MVIKSVILVVAILWFTACSNVQQELDKNIFYKRDLALDIGDVEKEGVAVVPYLESYRIKIKSPGDMDYFIYRTCHRQEEHERVGKRFSFLYQVSLESRDGILCPMELESFEAGRGRHAWGFVAFEDKTHRLPSVVKCNGKSISFNGVSVCQAKEGLIQNISFMEKVIMKGTDRCDFKSVGAGKDFSFTMHKGICVYEFLSLESDSLHKLYTIGYEQGLIRK